MKTLGPLFFIAVLPDAQIQQEVTTFKQACARLFQASHALTSPPHITLIPPFVWLPERLPQLHQVLHLFAAGQRTFGLSLRGFNCFQPRVIFVDVVENQQLKDMQAALSRYLEQLLDLKAGRGKPFHPHLTIAHRDLTPQQFPKAWEHFSKMEYQREFSVESLALLEHVNRRWLEREKYFFQGS